MNNLQLIKRWKESAIKFKTSKEVIPLIEMFLVCCGETVINVGGKEETVVIFYQAYDDKGSPSAMFTSDGDDNCWAYALNTEQKTHVKSKIGKFIKYESSDENDELAKIRRSKKHKK